MAKKIAVHQPNLLPWSGYFHKIANSDVFVFLDNVDIELGTSKAITTRCKIKTPSGEQWLTIPLKKSETKLIQHLNYLEGNWRSKMVKTVAINYGKAEFFKNVFPLIEEIIHYEANSVADYNINGIKRICDYLNLNNCAFLKASEMGLSTEDRNLRLIEICQKANAEIYFSGRGGKNYHDESLFEDHGLTIEYTNYAQTPYKQLYGEFIPGLSILDSLFNKNEI